MEAVGYVEYNATLLIRTPTPDPSWRDLGYHRSSILRTRSVMFYNQNSPEDWIHRVQSSTSAFTRRDKLSILLLHGPASIFILPSARACELSVHIARFPTLSTTAGQSNNLQPKLSDRVSYAQIHGSLEKAKQCCQTP